jgi:hypothetical protein
MTHGQLAYLLELVIDMAHDYALETRIRSLINEHQKHGADPRTLVMNVKTWKQLVWEIGGRGYKDGYFWTPQPEATLLDPNYGVTTYLGIPILIKDFVADLDVIVGV